MLICIEFVVLTCIDRINMHFSDNHSIVMSLRTGNCFHTMERIHLIFISHSIVNEYINFVLDSVHLIKSICNNLLYHKRFLFPPYDFEEFYEGFCVPAGEVRWQIFRRINEEGKKLDAYLRTAPKITASVIQPGSCKQRVPSALAIFDPITSATII